MSNIKNSVVRILFVFLPVLFIMASSFIIGLGSQDDYQPPIDTAFEISNMTVEIEAYSNRTAKITETIDVAFNEPRSSIYRDLPVNGGLEIRDIIVEGRVFSVEKYGSFLAVDLDADNYIPSLMSRQYKLSYILDYSKAVKPVSYDTIPLNVIGFGWPTYIHNATVIISLPESPKEQLYYVGPRKTTGGADRITVTTEGSTITLTTNETLLPFEGITVGYVMPEGLMHSEFDYNIIWNLVVGLIVVVIAYIIYLFYGKDEPFTPVVNFSPPNNLNPAEAGYLIDTACSATDITSLIFYWASKNYLLIKEDKIGGLTLEKLKDLDDSHKGYEKMMFNSLFKSKNSVKVSSLKDRFYSVVTSVQTKLKEGYTSKLFRKGNLLLSLLMALATVITMLVWVRIASHTVSINYNNNVGAASVFIVGILFALGTMFFRYEPKLNRRNYRIYYYFLCIIGGIVFGFVLNMYFVPLYMNLIISLTLTSIMCFLPFVQSREKEYRMILNELIGFKNFLMDAEKERLEMLLKDNPGYYYDILPYANVLGVSKEWMDKFKDLTVEPPNWYISYRPFNFIIFNTVMMRSMSTISTTMVSRPAPSGSSGGGFGGGGGGGGFGGGGFGGGGGRSR